MNWDCVLGGAMAGFVMTWVGIWFGMRLERKRHER